MTPIRAQRHATVATDYKFKGSNTRVVGSNGEINANDKKDLLRSSMRFMEAASLGEIITEEDQRARDERAAVNKELLTAAFANDTSHRVLGERIADEIYMTSNRKGFSRRFLNRIELKQGDIPRFAVRKKNVTASYITGPSRLETQIVTDKWLTPPEFQLAARVFVPQNEINQSNSDVLEEKYVEALEAVMVSEDRLWYQLAQNTIGIDNNKSVIAGTLSPYSLMSVRQQVAKWGLKVPYCLMASDLFIDIVGDSDFIQAIEPVARHELVMTGELAVLYGMTLISEAYRHPEHKVLSQGEFACIADPLQHGAYSDRGGVDSAPINATTEKVMGRGWLLSESLSMTIANSRSVALAVRQ